MKQAHAAEAEIAAGKIRGPLHGVPYGLKDLIAVEGYPTTWGAKPFENQKFAFNATIVEKLNRAGAVLIGKVAMIELQVDSAIRPPMPRFRGHRRIPGT